MAKRAHREVRREDIDPGGEAPTLRVHAETNGGVQLQGWDKDTYSITTCKAAAPPEGQAEMLFCTDSCVDSGRRGFRFRPRKRSGRHGEWERLFF